MAYELPDKRRNTREASLKRTTKTPIKQDGIELKTMQQFKYLSNEGNVDVDVRSCMKSAWCKWRELTGILCNKKMSSKLKSKICKIMIRPAMTYRLEVRVTRSNF